MPVHATISNHAEDVVTKYKQAMKARAEQKKAGSGGEAYAAVPQRPGCYLDMEDYGLLAVATNVEFVFYLQSMVTDHGDAPSLDSENFMKKKFRCLVCVKNPKDIDRLEKFQVNGTVLTHHENPKIGMNHQRFARHKPTKNPELWHECQMRIVRVGDDKFRAACVQSVYKDSPDHCLAHRLWGLGSETPAEDLGGVKYVVELIVETITSRKHQLRGQLAALGYPIVGDTCFGGGKCDAHGNYHSWNRLALQCCELSFPLPEWHAQGNDKAKLVPSETRCIFHLNDAWWSKYLKQYETYHQLQSREQE
jgi:hypothetical protein